MTKIKFSIIVPIYNVEKYLEKCLESLKNQTYSNLEVIMVDDGSTDSSFEIAEKYAKLDNRFLVFHKENGGLSDARNYGVKKASGEYLLFIDSDDYVEETLCEVLNNHIQEDVDLVKFRFAYIKNEEVLESGEKTTFDTDGFHALGALIKEKLGFEMAPLYAYKKEYWLKENYQFACGHYHEDFGLIPIVIAKAKRVISIPEVLYFYVQREGSIVNEENFEKIKKRSTDILYHYDYLTMQSKEISFPKTIEILWNSYLAYAVLSCYYNLPKELKKNYKKEIQKRNILKKLRNDSFKYKIKKMIVKIKFYISR